MRKVEPSRAVHISPIVARGQKVPAEEFVGVEQLPARLEALVAKFGDKLKGARVINAATRQEVRYEVTERGLRPTWRNDEEPPEDGRRIKGQKKVGVIDEMASALRAAPAPGLTKEQLVDRIALALGRDPRHVAATVRTQLSRLPRVTTLKIKKTRKDGLMRYHAR